ncbi:hypothetical protein J3F84DRAFT_113129 [Trichoderma pleuroticola]
MVIWKSSRQAAVSTQRTNRRRYWHGLGSLPNCHVDEATLPRDSLVAAAAVKIVAPHAPGAWRCKRRLVAFLSLFLFCFFYGKFCGENLAGAEAFLRLQVAFSCFRPWLGTCVLRGAYCVKDFLSSASFLSRSQPPPSPIKHVGMEALGEFGCVSVYLASFGFAGLLWLVA